MEGGEPQESSRVATAIEATGPGGQKKRGGGYDPCRRAAAPMEAA